MQPAFFVVSDDCRMVARCGYLRQRDRLSLACVVSPGRVEIDQVGDALPLIARTASRWRGVARS